MPSTDLSQIQLEIHTLRYYYAFVKEGSVVGAAKSLHITQPTLSRQLINLEKQVGSPLYSREGRHVKLTEKGRKLYQYAESIINLVDKAENELAQEDQRITGRVFIGHAESASMHLMTEAMIRTRTRYPNIQFHLFTGATGDLFDKLEIGLLDFIMEGEAMGRPGYHQIMMPMADTWGMVLRKDDPLSHKEKIRPVDLEGKPILCSRQVLKVGLLHDWAGKSFDKMHQAATFNAGSFMINMLPMYGMAYSFTYESVFELNGHEDLCFRPLSPTVTSDWGLTWKKDRIFDASATAFLESVKELMDDDVAH